MHPKEWKRKLTHDAYILQRKENRIWSRRFWIIQLETFFVSNTLCRKVMQFWIKVLRENTFTLQEFPCVMLITRRPTYFIIPFVKKKSGEWNDSFIIIDPTSPWNVWNVIYTDILFAYILPFTNNIYVMAHTKLIVIAFPLFQRLT